VPFSIAKLEATFRIIQTTRMEGVPVINNNLNVEAINFREWNDHKLGILITPWFMNLMLIPNGDTDSTPKTGTIHQHVFPSGSYDFVAGFEEEVGHYLSCSLFSPMFEFENQEAAELTASEALKAIMNEENIDTSSQNPANKIEKMWSGEIPTPEKTHDFDGSKIETKVEKKEPRRKLSERLKEPTSRRDFLRGKAFREESTIPTDSKQV
jgi:[NiFe] hydrogenase assembly HybE family chaperone